MAATTKKHPLVVGAYTLFGEFAAGGMGTIHFARRNGNGNGSSQAAVAIKRLHPHLRRDEVLAIMLLDEARLAMSVRHRNVVEMLDVVSTKDELLLVMEYVPGLSLSDLMMSSPKARQVPLDVAVTIAIDVLHGLQASHESVGPDGRPLGLVHRDVSPHNIIVSAAGVTKLTDFGVAKAAGRLRSTRDGGIKGKIAYMSPEQVADGEVDARSDVYSTAVVLWEMLVGRPMFEADSDVALFGKAMRGPTERVLSLVPDIPQALDVAIWRALSRDPRRRYSSARAFADALTDVAGSDVRSVASWVHEHGRGQLEAREEQVREIVRANEELTLTITEQLPLQARPKDGNGDDTLTLDEFAPAAAAPTKKDKPNKQTGIIVLLLGALAVLVIGLLLRQKPPAPASPPPEVDPPRPTATATTTATTAALTTPSTVVPEPPTAATSTQHAAPKRMPPVPVRRHDTAPTGTSSSTAKDPKAADCNPPYSVDELGGKHFKSWCLR